MNTLSTMQPITRNICSRNIELFTGTPGSPLVIHSTDMNEGTELWTACKEAGCLPFTLAVINNIDWNNDLSPWKMQPIRKGDREYSGQADTYLAQLTDEILPVLLESLDTAPKYLAITGYSLAGLFALYAGYRTDVFSRIASVSGSTWYPDFLKFAAEHPLSENIQKIYLSLGDKEKKTRNPLLAPVEENTKTLFEYYKNHGIETIFELNPGNHFQDPVGRTAKGIQWMLNA